MAPKWWTLIAVSVATFMLLLDITVVNVALPAIRDGLGASFSDVQWVVDAYALTLAALVLTTGSLADRFGRRRVFSAGLGVFSAASLLCALASDATFLNLARALQGFGGAAMFAVSLALVAQEFGAGRQRATAMGVYGAAVGVAAIAVTQLRLRESRDPNATRVDWPGVVAFSGALLLLVLALVRGNSEGWGSGLIVSLFAASAVLLVAFVAIERRVREPMLPLALFRRPSFTGVQLAAFAVSASAFALFLYVSLYMQNYLGYSPLQAGLRYLPITVLSLLAAPIAGALLSRVPARLLLGAGLAITGAGLLLMSGVRAADGWTTLLAGLLVVGVGVGLLGPVIADVALSVVPKERSGMAAGINDTFRQLGVAVGVAVWGAIFIGRGAAKAGAVAAGTPVAAGDHPRRLVEAASSGLLGRAADGAPGSFRPVVLRAGHEGFLAGFNDVLTLGGLVSLAGAALALWLVREREIEREPMQRTPDQEGVGARPSYATRRNGDLRDALSASDR